MNRYQEVVARTKQLLNKRLANVAPFIAEQCIDASLNITTGKLLRTRFAAQLAQSIPQCDLSVVVPACAATELVHTASLFHDDLIDKALLRRRMPSLWSHTGATGAVLIGDLLFCQSIGILTENNLISYLNVFIEKVNELCLAEIEQELFLRGKDITEDSCLKIARGKTGPLFAFTAFTCGGQDKKLCSALEESGYLVGTAYQLADDLLDEVGSEADTGKTLGTDRLRRKFTLAHQGDNSISSKIVAKIKMLLAEATSRLQSWPNIKEAISRFIDTEWNSAVSLNLLCSENTTSEGVLHP